MVIFFLEIYIQDNIVDLNSLENEGNSKVILCERGILSGTTCENMFDVRAIPLLKDMTHLPVIADPSHGTGCSHIVPPIALSSILAGTV